ncbi:RCC1 domain-containing protein 1 [Blomia tropicalis]|nr:RCC1 domain-containing protein 1 [Blomia tropicalis]
MLFYCGFDTFLQFKQKGGKNNVFLQPLSDLILDQNDKVINAFIGWCSLFLQTGKGQVLYLGYSKCKNPNETGTIIDKNDLVVCSQVPKYIVNIECGAKETFLITIDLDLYKWTGFNFSKTFPTQISLNPDCQNSRDESEEKSSSAINNHVEASQFKVEQLCVGVEYSCLLTDDGRAYLFDITNGLLTTLLTNQKIISIGAGQEHILLLTEDGKVLSYGRGSRGQLGHNNLDNVLDTPAVTIEALDGIKCRSIAAGGWHSLALSETGDVYAWGWNESGQLGLSKDKVTMKATPIPLEISEDDSFMMISAGSRHSMAVSENGILFGWGWNKWGQLGLDPKTIVCCDSPQVIPVDEKVTNICCKFWSSLIETERDNNNV